MAKDLSYFMREEKEEIIKVKGPDSFKDEQGEVVEFEIKVLSQSTIQRINDMYKETKIATDKKGNPFVVNGEVIHETLRDSEKAIGHIIAESLIYPDLKDEKLMKHFNCFEYAEMAKKVFFNPAEYRFVQSIVLSNMGVYSSQDEKKDLETAKN